MHDLDDPENTYVYYSNGYNRRTCRACTLDRIRESHRRTADSRRAAKTHCKNGHKYVKGSFFLSKANIRVCLECQERTVCKNGLHEMTTSNTYWTACKESPHGFTRRCLACQNKRKAQYLERVANGQPVKSRKRKKKAPPVVRWVNPVPLATAIQAYCASKGVSHNELSRLVAARSGRQWKTEHRWLVRLLGNQHTDIDLYRGEQWAMVIGKMISDLWSEVAA